MKTVSENDARSIATQFVREIGMSLTPEAENELAAQVHNALRIDPASRVVVVVDGNGHIVPKVSADGTVTDISVKEFVAEAAARLGGQVKTAAKPQSKTTATLTSRMRDAIASRNSDKKALAAAEAARGNPWKAGQINRSRQWIILNHDPELADRLRYEAGAR